MRIPARRSTPTAAPLRLRRRRRSKPSKTRRNKRPLFWRREPSTAKNTASPRQCAAGTLIFFAQGFRPLWTRSREGGAGTGGCPKTSGLDQGAAAPSGNSGADGRRAGRGEFSEAHVTGSAAGGTARRAARDVLERRREILPVAFSEKGAIIRIRTFVRITAKGELF